MVTLYDRVFVKDTQQALYPCFGYNQLRDLIGGKLLVNINDSIIVPINEDNVGIITRTYYGFQYMDYYSTRFNKYGWNIELTFEEFKTIVCHCYH